MDIKTFTGILRAFLVPDSCLPGSLRVGFILKHSGNHAAYIRFFPFKRPLTLATLWSCQAGKPYSDEQVGFF